MPSFAELSPALRVVVIVGATIVAYFALWPLARVLEGRRHPVAGPLRTLRRLCLPLVAVFLVLCHGFAMAVDGPVIRVVETLLWIAALHISLSLLNALLFDRADRSSWRGNVPKLFRDVSRLLLVVVGTAFVLAGVWGFDLGGLLTALGVGSIVIGLALQDTLGSVVAGIAMVFERAFRVGDWIQVGQTEGQVVEITWRTVHLLTRTRDLVVLPNSVLGKETFRNYSCPTRHHAETYRIGFSYDDAPNKVKRILQRAAIATRGILADPPVQVRTLEYSDFSINYEVRFFIEDFARLLEIRDEFSTRIWYAAKRNGLTIPFPIRTVYKTEVPPPVRPEGHGDARHALAAVPVFFPLSDEEMESMGRHTVVEYFGTGERIVYQGDAGEAMYILRQGRVVVSYQDETGTEREVARLARGEFFGEMSLLTGEPRTASVTAVEDVEAIVVRKEALQDLLGRRPALAQEMAEIVTVRRAGLQAIKDLPSLPPARRAEVRDATNSLLQRIREFLGV